MLASGHKEIDEILRNRIGLDPASLGSRSVEKAAAERMRMLGIAAVSSYAGLLSGSPAELEALIELVVIPETWFFRDREPFVFLADFIRSDWNPLHATDTLRILSAPCATGEEPYSIVMTCLDCGLARSRFVVDAIDINEKFLGKAKKAVYGRNSFRGADLAFRERYFIAEGTAYSLKPEVRALARFYKANMMEPATFPPFVPYDIVFCRNLMIYLHEQARLKTIAAIGDLLAPGGLLFVGHAEATPTIMETFENVNHAGSFALRKRTQKQSGPFSPATAGKVYFSPIAAPPADIRAKAPHRTPATGPGPETAGHPTAAGAPENIERATLLADAGRLKEAEEECRHILGADAGNAGAYFLLGVISEVQGNDRGAEECFQRAIYLNADFADAILHLAMLKEENGDDTAAGLLRRRAASIKPRDAQRK